MNSQRDLNWIWSLNANFNNLIKHQGGTRTACDAVDQHEPARQASDMTWAMTPSKLFNPFESKMNPSEIAMQYSRMVKVKFAKANLFDLNNLGH